MKVLKQMFAVCVLGAACSVAAVEIQELKTECASPRHRCR